MNVGGMLERAKSQLGLGAKYRLGGGKTRPVGSDCLDEDRGCDCSAFVTWVLRLPKWQQEEMWFLARLNGGWLNTDGMWIDAHRPFGFFERLEAPLPGCIVVFPAHKGRDGLPAAPGPKVGHVGIVTEVKRKMNGRDSSKPWEPESFSIGLMHRTEVKKVVHCSGGNFRGWGDAIRETDPKVWGSRRSTIYAWPSSVEPLVPPQYLV